MLEKYEMSVERKDHKGNECSVKECPDSVGMSGEISLETSVIIYLTQYMLGKY